MRDNSELPCAHSIYLYVKRRYNLQFRSLDPSRDLMQSRDRAFLSYTAPALSLSLSLQLSFHRLLSIARTTDHNS